MSCIKTPVIYTAQFGKPGHCFNAQVFDSECDAVATIESTDNPDHASEIARRIAACINSCAGISTENLEDNLPVAELARRYNETLIQRNDLLALLKEIDSNGYFGVEDWPRIKAAISKAEGRA